MARRNLHRRPLVLRTPLRRGRDRAVRAPRPLRGELRVLAFATGARRRRKARIPVRRRTPRQLGCSHDASLPAASDEDRPCEIRSMHVTQGPADSWSIRLLRTMSRRRISAGCRHRASPLARVGVRPPASQARQRTDAAGKARAPDTHREVDHERLRRYRFGSGKCPDERHVHDIDEQAVLWRRCATFRIYQYRDAEQPAVLDGPTVRHQVASQD